MPNTLKIKRGLASSIPQGQLAEPLFTTDTYDLYIGKGSGGNQRIQNYIASGTTNDILRGDGSVYTFPLGISSPSAGQVLKYNGTSWVNDSDAGITGTGTTNTLPKFTGATTLGNSNVTDSGTLITLGSNSYVNGALGIGSTALTGYTLRLGANLTGATTSYAIRNTGIVQSDVTSSAFGVSNTLETVAAAFTLGNYYHFAAGQSTIGAGSALTNQYGYFVDSTLTGATNNYGFYGNIASGTNRWNLYMNGTANNYLAGSLGIGSTTLTGYSLVVGKNITGAANAQGIRNNGVIQSDVTGYAVMYNSVASTAAAAFTNSQLVHYYAQQSTFGAGSAVTYQYGFLAESSLTGASNNYGFYGAIASGTGRWNLYMIGTADNFLAGNLGIGVSQTIVSSGPILTTTLTSSGSGYVDGTYTDVASTVVSGSGTYALFTIVVSGGIVTTATLTWGGSTYKVGTTLTVSNTLLGGTGSGLVITVDTVDSSQLYVASATGGDINLFRNDTSVGVTDNIGSIKWNGNDASTKASGIYAKIGAFGAGSSGGAYLSFFTSTGAGGALTEQLRIGSGGQVGIGTGSFTGYNLRVSKNITGATTAYGIVSDGQIQSGVTSNAYNFLSYPSTAAASFTLTSLHHFNASQNAGLGAGSAVTNQFGFVADSSLTAATNNYGFYGNIASAANRWNLYMNGTANNYMAGSLGIGTTSLTQYSLRISKNISGNATNSYGVLIDGQAQSSVTGAANYIQTTASTQAASYTLITLGHFVAAQGTFGAGSTVTNQYGFYVDSSLTGATNNYGFYGNIASGANRWNLYMNGTAANYLAGDTGIGTTLATSYGMKLAVLDSIGLVPTTQNTSGSAVYLKSQLGSSGGENFIKNEIVVYNNAANYTTALSFLVRNLTSSLEVMRINPNGLSIGTTSSNGRLTIQPANDTVGISVSGSSLTGTNAQSLLDLSQTWNTTGYPTAIKLNITNTASGILANLMDLQVGGATQFLVDKAGAIKTSAPSGGTAGKWKLGSKVTATVALVTTDYIELEVDGVAYKVGLVS